MMQVSGCEDSQETEGRAKRPGFQYSSLLVCVFHFVCAEHPLLHIKGQFLTRCVRGLEKYGGCSTKSSSCFLDCYLYAGTVRSISSCLLRVVKVLIWFLPGRVWLKRAGVCFSHTY